MCLIILGMIPCPSAISPPPTIVYVFPEPVCPYAKIVPLNPSIALSATSFATLSNICYCGASISKIWSNLNLTDSFWLLIYPWFSSLGVLIVTLLFYWSTSANKITYTYAFKLILHRSNSQKSLYCNLIWHFSINML